MAAVGWFRDRRRVVIQHDLADWGFWWYRRCDIGWNHPRSWKLSRRHQWKEGQ